MGELTEVWEQFQRNVSATESLKKLAWFPRKVCEHQISHTCLPSGRVAVCQRLRWVQAWEMLGTWISLRSAVPLSHWMYDWHSTSKGCADTKPNTKRAFLTSAETTQIKKNHINMKLFQRCLTLWVQQNSQSESKGDHLPFLLLQC